MSANTENHRSEELADFLKTRRAKISPVQAGLPATARRRTPGLRREEVAQLAGIGLTWYTWLEQGRDIHVSSSVIESLARVLLLDKHERIHLYRLANQPMPSELPETKATVAPALLHVLDHLTLCPSFIADRHWNVVAWNKAACFLFGDFCAMSGRQRNVVWGMFTDDYFKQLYADWDLYARVLIGRFRATCGKYIEDPWLISFIEDLKKESAEFKQWWPLHDIQDDSSVYKTMNHPSAGTLYFESSSFDVPDQSGLRLFVHTPLPGTDTAEKIKTAYL